MYDSSQQHVCPCRPRKLSAVRLWSTHMAPSRQHMRHIVIFNSKNPQFSRLKPTDDPFR